YIPQNKMYPQSARGASAAHAPTETASSVPHRIAVDRSAAHASPTGFPAFPSQNAHKTQADSRLSTGSPCPVCLLFDVIGCRLHNLKPITLAPKSRIG